VATTGKERTVRAGTNIPAPQIVFRSMPRPLPAGTTWPPPDTKPFPGTPMPTGLTDALSAPEKRDLFAFLAKLGAPGGLEASDRHAARVWRIESDTQERPGSFINRQGNTGGTGQIHSLINGDLRRVDCLDALYQTDRDRTFYVGTLFIVKTAGQVRLELTGIQDAWLDGQKLESPKPAATVLDLAAGRHRLDVKLDPSRMPEKIRAASPDAEFIGDSIWAWKD
jgi:hypothetical protein